MIVIKHGSGAIVSSQTTPHSDREELRKSLCQSLTGMVLAGLPRTEILRMVTEELKSLLQGGRA